MYKKCFCETEFIFISFILGDLLLESHTEIREIKSGIKSKEIGFIIYFNKKEKEYIVLKNKIITNIII